MTAGIFLGVATVVATLALIGGFTALSFWLKADMSGVALGAATGIFVVLVIGIFLIRSAT